MDTARVDIRKLQMLNDRINQTIDALNQVRLSVHGISHTGAVPGLPFANAYGVPSQFVSPFGVAGQVPGMIPGFAHTAGVNPLAYAAAAANNPFLAQQLWAQQNAVNTVGIPTGLGHTGDLESLYGRTWDPTTQMGRIGQTFPFAQWGYSPFAQGFSPFASANY
jgi:hypothetical protein